MLRRPIRSNNILQFPDERRTNITVCPNCGTHTGVWRFGRLLSAYCDTHEVRWVAADLGQLPPVAAEIRQLRKYLELLASFVEVTPSPE